MRSLLPLCAAVAVGCAVPVEHRGPVTATAQLGSRALSCSQAGVLEATERGLRPFADPGFRPFAMATTADVLLVGGGLPQRTGEVATFDRDGRALARARIADDLVYAVALAPDGTFGIAALADGRVLRLPMPNLAPEQLLWQHAGPATVAALSPDGDSLATGGRDGKILLGAPLPDAVPRALLDHTAAVTALSWSPDGERLLSGAEDGKARLHANAGRLLHSWTRLGGRVQSVRFVAGGCEATVASLPGEPPRRIPLR